MPQFLNDRFAAQLQSLFGTVNLGDWSGDQDVPYWLAIRINVARSELRASVTSVVQLAAQAKLSQDSAGGQAIGRLTSEVIDDWCGTRVPGRPPRPHWTAFVTELGFLAESYPEGSTLRESAFELSRRVIDRASEVAREREVLQLT